MHGLLLSRAEMLVLLDAVRAQTIVGLDEPLIPESEAEHRVLVEQGHASLQARGLAQTNPNGGVALDAVLVTVASIITKPETAIIVVRHDPERGDQGFWFYRAGALIVEHTLPDAQTHRIATIPDGAHLLARISQILPLVNASPPAAATLAEATFGQAKTLAENRQTQSAKALLASAFAAEAATALVQAIQQPVFSGSLAILRTADGQIVDARSLAVLQSAMTAWLISQATPGETSLRIETADQETLRQQIERWLNQLAPIAA